MNNENIAIIKNTKNNGELCIKEISYSVAKKMMLEKHYSKKWNNAFGKINIGIYRNGELLGAAVFGNLMNTKSYKNLVEDKKSIIELNRLYIDDVLVKNAETVLISSSIKIIKRKYPYIKYVQSFADGRLGCGTIYKAANFDYYGCSKSIFFENKQTKEIFHKVPLENTDRPSGFLNKNRLFIDNKLVSFYVKTYRYIYDIYKINGIKLKKLVYPEYSIGSEKINFVHPLSTLCRLYLMYTAIEDYIYANKCMDTMLINYDKENINFMIEKQKLNKSYINFLKDYLPKNGKNKLMKNIEGEITNDFFQIN